MLSVLFLCLQAAWGLAPFLSQSETIDRTVDGVQQRSYFVIFNEKAPDFGLNKEKLQGWLEVNFPEVDPDDVQHIYHLGMPFRGFSIWADRAKMDAFLAYEGTKYVEEDQVMRIMAPFTQRPDYGQVRVLQKGARNLATTPSGGYNGTTYPSGGSDTTVWDWTSAVYTGYRLINSGSGAVISIVDTGIVQNHQEFMSGGRSRVIQSVDYVSPSTNGTDCNGHGTHCAGSAAGQNRGLAPGADLRSVRVLGCTGSGSNTGVVSGFNWVGNNIVSGKTNILSASLGGGASQATDDAINAADAKGVVCVVAAGNSNADACGSSPSRASGAITIGATNKDDGRASFSNFGTCVNVFAPGQSIHSAYGTSATQTTTYNTLSGTSMATPLAAGAIAIYGTQAVRTPAQVRTAIINTATTGVITSPGTGSPNRIIYGQWA